MNVEIGTEAPVVFQREDRKEGDEEAKTLLFEITIATQRFPIAHGFTVKPAEVYPEGIQILCFPSRSMFCLIKC